MKKVVGATLVILLVVGCEPPLSDHGDPSASNRSLGLGVDVDNFDRSVRPQDDFYHYVNGTWLEKTEIPADKSAYGSFTEIRDKAARDLRAIVEDAANAEYKTPGSDLQKVGDFYLSFMDSTRAEDLGLTPIHRALSTVDDIETRGDLIRYFAHARKTRVGSPLGFYVGQDAKNTTQYTLYLSQSGLGLPDRDYYFEEQFTNTRDKYVVYIENMHNLAGWVEGDREAQTIMTIETRLAEHQWTRVQNRDRNAVYNKYTLDEANELTPNVDWNVFLEAADISPIDDFIIRQPSYFEALDNAVVDVSIADWKTYLRFKVLANAAPYLPEKFVEASFDFYGRTLNGTEQNRPRWRRAVSSTNGVMGEMVGKLYVEEHYQQEARARMDEMIKNLRDAFEVAINELEWMSDETKAEAQAKLAKFTPKIGFPKKWKDYADLEIRSDDLIGNLNRSARVEYERMVNKLGKPIDKGEWFMTPQTVNAYYSPSMNEIVFPAGILQPPFFNVEADDAVNYGAIGAAIGHEFSHGFDDQGRKSDGDGNLRDWWTEQDGEEFQRRAAILGEQFSSFSPVEGMNVNGELTMGENIGDLAGLTMAYKAYKRSLGGNEAPVIDGFKGEQRFFLGWAQVWRRKYRDDSLRRYLVTDPHSPGEYRTNGILANMPEFYEAFEVQEGDAMYRPEDIRVKIW